jgi:uncharacterized protein (TIGR02996 family)
MPVYFVYRCHSGAPSEKHVRRFEYDTVLEWAQGVWKLHGTRQEAEQYARQLFGDIDLGPLWGLFEAHEDHDAERPRKMIDVERWFGNAMYCEDDPKSGPHHIQVLTDWGDNQRAVYVFDDHFRARKPGKADFLLLDGWELPAGESDGPVPRLPKTSLTKRPGKAEGTLYFADTFVDCKYNLEDLEGNASRLPGVRVPDLARYLLLQRDPESLHFTLGKLHDALREVLEKPAGEDAGFLAAIRDQPEELTNWGAYSDWLQDRDLPPAGLHLLDLALRTGWFAADRESRRLCLDRMKVTAHMAQACKHEGRYPDRPGDEATDADCWEQFFFFDDRWAAAHPTLAAGVITFTSRWDVLS